MNPAAEIELTETEHVLLNRIVREIEELGTNRVLNRPWAYGLRLDLTLAEEIDLVALKKKIR